MPTLRTLAITAALLAGAASAQATLVDRGGGMIYDSELNITWLKDWNYAKTQYTTTNGAQGDSDGLMTWSQASTWASNLVYGGYDDWRLPTMVDTGTAGCNLSYVGGTDCGFNVQTKSGSTVYSEMAHLYYETLANKSYCNPLTSTATGCAPQAGYGMLNTGPFSNMQSDAYWSGLEYAPDPSFAWDFSTFNGYQYFVGKSNALYAVAVRPGDVAAAVPEPQALVLMTLGVGAVMCVRRRRPL